MNNAVSDFMYLVQTADPTPSPAFFSIREGLRLHCPKCHKVNSYEMPKTASDLSCGYCNIVVPAKVVMAALGNGAAKEEVTLVEVIQELITEIKDLKRTIEDL